VKRTAPANHTRADRSAREKAYLLIQQKIARGELAPGSAVSEIPLAQELGSSRTPIREALGQLVAEGLLEQTPNRGAVVVRLGRHDIIDLYELREALEVYAAGKVAACANIPQDLERLQAFADQILSLRDELLECGRDKLDARQMHRFISCDLGFHTLLLRLASNARILKVVNETRLLIRIFAIHRHGHNIAALTKIHGQHREILDAVSERNSTRVMTLMSDHIRESQQERLAEYDEWEHEASLRESLPAFFHFHSSPDQPG
jgi:DNA-binding GntR family transcriptional regulator